MKKQTKGIISLILAVSLLLALGGCGQSKGSSSSGGSASGKKPQTVVVSMDGGTRPFNYKNDKGKLVGYEVDLLKEIQKRSNGAIKFKYNITNWDGIFASLDSGKADMIVNNITKKPEREKKYLFSDYSYFNNETVLVVRPGEKNIRTIADLQGKKIEVTAGTAVTLYLEDYNKKHKDNPIKLVYSDAPTASIIQNVALGRYPASIWAKSYVDAAVKKLGIKVKIVHLKNQNQIQDSEAWFLYGAKEQKLKKEIDPLLKEIKDDGTLSKLSKKWFGGDYTKAKKG